MLFKELRKILRDQDIDHCYLGKEILGHSPSYVSMRMTGKLPWAMDDMYKILDETNTPHEKLHIVFPLGGVAPKTEPVPMPVVDEDAICTKVFARLGEVLAVVQGQAV